MSEPADGRQITSPAHAAHAGEVTFAGRRELALLTFTRGASLLGAGLLRRHRVEIDCPRRAVVVEDSRATAWGRPARKAPGGRS